MNCSLNFGGEKQRRLELADFALFTALWWPEAPLAQLEVLAYLAIWLFTWDDEIDEPSGSYAEDISGAQAYRDSTLHFIVQSFDVIGSALRASYDANQCQRFYDEISRFMTASRLEQDTRMRGDVPTLNEYWNFRLGTSAVYIGTAPAVYSLSLRLPSDLMQSEPMQALWRETNVTISITNDLVSLRKEIKSGCIDSMVPLLFASLGDIEKAVSESVTCLRTAKLQFDQAAHLLLFRDQGKKGCLHELETFI
ncbi:Uu.00g142560.m01.CDS01 [Anthostomella pinea]|uniref:Uu.00g142560.m01.CDS01 n=1 Tax=Anthostomella pinea TaxID=933095 RepID=A0AAI8YLQ3_9PEZI|nr:Uu.00g142560.m01.CDS01 [Anthostomella pinea]